MYGMARSTNFMLGTAEVMVGPSADLYTLNGADHALGLVKNFQLASTPTNVNLPKGMKGSPSKVARAGNRVSAQMSLYEYTPKNISYILGLIQPTINTAYSVLVQPAASNATTLTVADAAGFTAGETISVVFQDVIVSRVIDSVAAQVITLTDPIGFTVPTGAVVMSAQAIDLGGVQTPPTYAMRVVGTLADNTPVEIQLPKVFFTSDLNALFSSDDFGYLDVFADCLECHVGDPLFEDFPHKSGKMIIGSRPGNSVVSGEGFEFWDGGATWDNFTLWK